MKIVNVCGTRPNFVKIAPIMRAYKKYSSIEPLLIHTGQHYSDSMSNSFFIDLDIPNPNINLGIGSGSHIKQIANIMLKFEEFLIDSNPDYVLVVGDVNSTVACAIVAYKMNIKVIHVESGLRSFDQDMPEEMNRIITDIVSDILFVTEESAIENLKKEGLNSKSIYFVGNVMIDSLMFIKNKLKKSNILNRIEKNTGSYNVATLHRPSNIECKDNLYDILSALCEINKDKPVYFPIHPRTEKIINSMGLSRCTNIINVIEPLGYIDFIKLISNANCVITDSGGIQEETTILKVPCITVRKNTERPVTICKGTNILAGISKNGILKAYEKCKKKIKISSMPNKWDGNAANRIVDILYELDNNK